MSTISFLNAVPLNYSIWCGDYPEWMEVSYGTPAQCADDLKQARTDVGLIPAIEFHRQTGLKMLPSMAIASPGQVRSVILLSSKPLEDIHSIGVTPHSRTSVALTNIIFSEFLQQEYHLSTFDTVQNSLDGNDGTLIIGDEAMVGEFKGLRRFDLAQIWYRFTGFPFVFAFWAARCQVKTRALTSFLLSSKKKGLENLPAIARSFSESLGLPEEDLLSYLVYNLSYDFGPKEETSLQLFFKLYDQGKWSLGE